MNEQSKIKIEEVDFTRYKRQITSMDIEPNFSELYSKEGLYFFFKNEYNNYYFNRPMKCFILFESFIHSTLLKKEITDTNINELLIRIDDLVYDLKVDKDNFVDYECLKVFLVNFYE